MVHHISKNMPLYTGEYNVEDYALAIQQWNHMKIFTYVKRDPTISIEDYKMSYWYITHPFVLKVPIEEVPRNPYTPQATFERNAVDGIYKTLEMLEKLE